MQAANKIESFCIDRNEKFLFAGTIGGQIWVIDINDFSVVKRIYAHAGGIMAMYSHPRKNYFTCISMDRTFSIWIYDEKNGTIDPLHSMSIRNIRPSNDLVDIDYVVSNSQAIALNDVSNKLVTRSGNAALIEFNFDHDRLELIHSTRFHGDKDIVCVRYVNNSDKILSGSGAGDLVLSEGSKELNRWKIEEESIHWIEHFKGDEYFIASDARLIARVNIESGELILGPVFAIDDLEHITYNKTNHKAYASSFDRTVYEIDVENCRPLQQIYKADFKCRWIKSLTTNPNILIVQVRNGSLIKYNVPDQSEISRIKETPPALWTSVKTRDNRTIFFGEGSDYLEITPREISKISLSTNYSKRRISLQIKDSNTYTKRATYNAKLNQIYLGQTNGDVIEISGTNETNVLINYQSAIRDLVYDSVKNGLYIACENGKCHFFELENKNNHVIFETKNNKPIWSLAYNPINNIVAFFERWGDIILINAKTHLVLKEINDAGRAKRAKWLDEENLIYSHGGELYKYNVNSGLAIRIIQYAGNTIEDFIWDEGQNYLVTICYTCMMHLFDFKSFELLSTVPDQMDYSKGICWLNDYNNGNKAYPLDFVTFGRSNNAHRFRIFNDNIVSLGKL